MDLDALLQHSEPEPPRHLVRSLAQILVLTTASVLLLGALLAGLLYLLGVGVSLWWLDSWTS